jgi:SNF2 family DNA or RNA helicase
VAPTALLLQWKAELELHTDGEPLRILVYHGAAKKKHTTKKSLQKYDVVITTYATVAMEKPTYDELNKKRKKKKDDFITSGSEYDSEEKVKKDGPLINFRWYRVCSQSSLPLFPSEPHLWHLTFRLFWTKRKLCESAYIPACTCG